MVRLDIWHFMQRLAFGDTTESHPLYGTFLSRLSSCIFEWDESDVEALLEAKRAELSIAGVPSPSVAAANPAVRSKELACHCQSRTRGVERTVEMIEALLLSLSNATDLLGVTSPKRRNEGHLGRAEEARCLHSRSSWCFPLHCHIWANETDTSAEHTR